MTPQQCIRENIHYMAIPTNQRTSNKWIKFCNTSCRIKSPCGNIRNFLILELDSSIFGNIRNFFGADFFIFSRLGLKVAQVAAYDITNIRQIRPSNKKTYLKKRLLEINGSNRTWNKTYEVTNSKYWDFDISLKTILKMRTAVLPI